jgi:hypothetical protein
VGFVVPDAEGSGRDDGYDSDQFERVGAAARRGQVLGLFGLGFARFDVWNHRKVSYRKINSAAYALYFGLLVGWLIALSKRVD